MGKRSDFERVDRDFYPTPYEAVTPLFSHLPERCVFVEPCAGDGRLCDHIESMGHECLYASDIEPRGDFMHTHSFEGLDSAITDHCDYIITNPPWDRKLLHPMIRHFAALKPTWLLFDADWLHTRQSVEFLPWLVKVVSVGRVKWIPDSKMTGKDNCCWYLFDARNDGPTTFFGRSAK